VRHLAWGVASILAAPALDDYSSAVRKFEMILTDRAASRSAIVISADEINAWTRTEVIAAVPAGLRNPRIHLGAGGATGTALLDFVALRRAQGEPPGRVLSWLLKGERPVSVSVWMRSGGGRCTVFVKRVEISGFPIQGAALDFLLENYLLPRYPDAKIGQPFDFAHRVDRIEVTPAGVRVVIGG